MTFHEHYYSDDDGYSLGIQAESGRYAAWFPVTNGVADYQEYYVLAPEQYDRFLADHAAALAFVEEARAREHDDLLLQKPGWNRGIPY